MTLRARMTMVRVSQLDVINYRSGRLMHHAIDFVVDDNEGDAGPRARLYTWDALDSWEEDNSPELLQDLALDVQRRHRAVSNTHAQRSSSYIFEDAPVAIDRLPAVEDMIWRVRVQVSLSIAPSSRLTMANTIG